MFFPRFRLNWADIHIYVGKSVSFFVRRWAIALPSREKCHILS
ncbi:hypothetical protein [Cohnella terricola]|nr:hypothetical protein [Cohnella terricola]